MSWSGACNDTAKFTFGRSALNLLIPRMIPTCSCNVTGRLKLEFITTAVIIKKNQSISFSNSKVQSVRLNLSAMVQCFSLTTNQPTVLSAMAYQPIKQWQNTPWLQS
jgi:hypothetical protein